MLSRLGLLISRVFSRVVPDPFVIAILLTAVTLVLALLAGEFPIAPGGSPPGLARRLTILLDAWRGDSGLWYFLAFSMQMCLILVTGHALAETRPVASLLRLLADVPRTTAQAAAMVGLVACTTAVANWGLGLIVGALLARDVGRSMSRRGIRAHYPLIVAAGYTGLMVWHGGLSGSAPLSMTTSAGARRVLRDDVIARLGDGGIPLQETTLSSMNLVITGGLLLLTPLVLWLLAPRRPQDLLPIEAFASTTSGAEVSASEAGQPRPVTPHSEQPTIPDRLERSFTLAALVAAALALAVGRQIWLKGVGAIGLNEVNMAMLAVGLLLHGSIRSYAAAVEGAMRGCAGILLQFPLYGGIMAMLAASGLVGLIAGTMGTIATPQTLPFYTFVSAGITNLFVPSGGGQWAVQGPIALETAFRMGVEPGRIVMAVAYGDQLTNMLQPFWALPLLAITGVRARDIVGYTALVMVVAGAWIALGLAIL